MKNLKRGSAAVNLAVILTVLLMVSALFSEYYRIHSLRVKVENQLIQAANVSLEAAMRDPYRQDHTAVMDKDYAQEVFQSYLHFEMGLDTALSRIGADGKRHYSLESAVMNFEEQPPVITFRCTLRIPSMFSFLPNDMLVPMNIRSKNGRLL